MGSLCLVPAELLFAQEGLQSLSCQAELCFASCPQAVCGTLPMCCLSMENQALYPRVERSRREEKTDLTLMCMAV